jgi:MFS family permease
MLQTQRWVSRDVLLICFSAFFADLGYQGVTALFPLFLVIQLHQPAYVYGIITALSFGIGSFFAYIGGRAGDRFDKKQIALLGNIFIPLMAFSGLTHLVWLSGVLYILGWWARYFRTPARRALLVNVSPREFRAKVFGFLHALDIGGGMLSALIALGLVALHVPIGTIILFAIAPLLVSSLVLALVRRDTLYLDEPTETRQPSAQEASQQVRRSNNVIFIALLVSATFYGFSFYNLGFPILTAATTQHSYSYLFGILTYVIYLGVSAISGYVLGSTRIRPLRALWSFGYFPSALASLLIGLSYLFHLYVAVFYIFVAGLGFGMGAAETFEPTLTSFLVSTTNLSGGMGWLSVSRSIGQFLANLIMGFLFSFSQFASYLYAFASALVATAILLGTEQRTTRQQKEAPAHSSGGTGTSMPS